MSFWWRDDDVLTVVQYEPLYVLHDLTVALSSSVCHLTRVFAIVVDCSWLGVEDERDGEESFDPFDLRLC
jgi:hypothetical protein